MNTMVVSIAGATKVSGNRIKSFLPFPLCRSPPPPTSYVALHSTTSVVNIRLSITAAGSDAPCLCMAAPLVVVVWLLSLHLGSGPERHAPLVVVVRLLSLHLGSGPELLQSLTKSSIESFGSRRAYSTQALSSHLQPVLCKVIHLGACVFDAPATPRRWICLHHRRWSCWCPQAGLSCNLVFFWGPLRKMVVVII